MWPSAELGKHLHELLGGRDDLDATAVASRLILLNGPGFDDGIQSADLLKLRM